MTFTLEQIAEKTERNQHGVAINRGLTRLNLPKDELEELQDEMILIQAEHEREGGLSPRMNGKRYKIYKYMMEVAKAQFSENEFAAFHSCF